MKTRGDFPTLADWHQYLREHSQAQIIDAISEESQSEEPAPRLNAPKPRPARKAKPFAGFFGAMRGIGAKFAAARESRSQNDRPGKSKLLANKYVKYGGLAVILIVIGFLAWMYWPMGTGGGGYEAPQYVEPAPQYEVPQFAAQPEPTAQPSRIVIQGSAKSLKGLFKEIKLVTIGFIALLIFSLLESQAQGDPVLLDFFAAWGVTALLVVGQLYGHDNPLFWVLLGFGIGALVIGIIWNPSEENETKLINKIDTTHLYVLGWALIFLRFMKSSVFPYPDYVPVIIPILLIVVGMGKEIFRQVGFSLIVIGVLLIPAFIQTPVALSLGLAGAVAAAAIAAGQGWVTVRGSSKKLGIGGRELSVIIAWDIVLFYVAEVVFIGYLIYGNYAMFTIIR